MTRIFTAIGLVIFAVYLVFFAPQPIFVAGALLMSLLCYWEFGNLAVAHSIIRPGLLGVALGIALMLRPQDALLAATLWFLVQLTLSLRRSNLREIAPEAAATIFGAFYCFAPWRYAVDLRAVSPQVLFFALALNWVGDSSAFYAGRLFGKHKLAPTCSLICRRQCRWPAGRLSGVCNQARRRLERQWQIASRARRRSRPHRQ